MKGFKIRRNILQNAVIYMIGSFFTQGLTFITLPIFSNILSPADFGMYASYNFWIAITGLIIGIQLSATIGNAYIDFGKQQIYGYASSLSSINICSFIIVFGVVIVFIKPLSALFELPAIALYLGLVQCLFVFFINCIVSVYRFMSKPFKYVIFSIGNASMNIVLAVFFITYLNHNKYMGRIVSSVVAAILLGTVAFVLTIVHGKKIYNYQYIKYGLLISLPLIFHSLAGIILGKIDQIILLKLRGASVAGIYSYANNFGQIISVLYGAFNQAFVPWYYSALAEKRKEDIRVASKLYIRIFTLISIIVICVLPEIIQIMSSKSYYSAIYVSPILIAAYFINFIYTFPVNFEFFHKKTNFIAIGTILAMIMNLMLDFILIPCMGGEGAAVATLISYVILFLVHIVIVKRKLGNYEMHMKDFAPWCLLEFLAVAMYYILLPYPLIRWGIGIGVAMLILLHGIKMLKTNTDKS